MQSKKFLKSQGFSMIFTAALYVTISFKKLNRVLPGNCRVIQKNFKLIWLILFLLMLALTGCDIFNTRSAEKPTQPRSDFEPAATEDRLIQNLKNALEDKDVTNYLNCLSDSSFTDKRFHFSPSNEAVATYPTLMDWNKRNEEQYFTNMIIKVSDNSKITLNLTGSSRNNFGDSTFYTASYSLTVPFVNSNSQITPVTYEGTLTFKMVRDSRSIWGIYFWQDNKNTNATPSWSDLKGSLAN